MAGKAAGVRARETGKQSALCLRVFFLSGSGQGVLEPVSASQPELPGSQPELLEGKVAAAEPAGGVERAWNLTLGL